MLLIDLSSLYLLTMSEIEEQTEKTPEPETASIKFSFKPVEEKPTRKYRKGSKYDPILEAFLKSDEKLSELSVKGKDANYIRTQLNKRIEARKLTKKIKVSVVNNIVFLEK